VKICGGVIRVNRSDRRTALRVILALLGVVAGWAAASYAFVYFTGNGVTSGVATGYSIIVWLAVIGAFWLMAFKANLRK
jgi:hypothetical protein